MSLYVGTISDDEFPLLLHATKKDCNNFAAGLGEWESVRNLQYDPASGLLSGEIDHFSVVAAARRPVPVASFSTQKQVRMGGGCPNECSGHGHCRAEAKCNCFTGFAGFDCSVRQCPYGDAWGIDAPVTRQQVECSGRGSCNRNDGICHCYGGYAGDACQRTTCPNDCSGHGKCRYVSELDLAAAAGYNAWDAHRIQVCKCDSGYLGADCAERECPRGDDPQTVCDEQDTMVNRITVSFATTAGTIMGNALSLRMSSLVGYGTVVTSAVSNIITGANAATATALANAFEFLPNFLVNDVTVALDASTADSASYLVTFVESSGHQTGSRPTLSCPQDDTSLVGCPFAGCRPRYDQLVKLSSSSSMGTVAGINLVMSPSSWLVRSTDATLAGTGATFDVHVRVWIRIDTLGTRQLISIAHQSETTVGGVAVNNALVAPTEPEKWTLLGPVGSSQSQHVATDYGLLVSLNPSDPVVTIVDGTATFDWYWSLPECQVTVEREAGIKYENHECSGRGSCDRKTGLCQCFAGYEGGNCGY